jgi:hypothetical protein
MAAKFVGLTPDSPFDPERTERNMILKQSIDWKNEWFPIDDVTYLNFAAQGTPTSCAESLHGGGIRGNPMGECAVNCGECKMQEYQGGCHCGALGIIYRTDIDPMYWRLRHDGCSFCRRHGVVGTSDAAGNLSVDIQDPSKVRYYRFAHRTADFLICGECGVFVAAITDTAQGKRAVINARVLDGVSLNWASVADVHFDDESPPQRAERRSLHWTPVVR